VSVAEASRVSLWVWFPGPPPLDGSTWARLRLGTANGEAVLSACRFVADPSAGADGRLVFTEDVYDCRSLIADGTVVNVRAFFQNLALVVSQREKVRPDFKEFVADAMYDISAYKRFFDEQESVFAAEPPDVAAAARDALVRAEHGRFFKFMEEHLRGLEAVVKGFTREEHERHGFYLRRQAWHYIVATEFLRHINVKPRGYAGDADSMVMIYRDEYRGKTAFHRLLHKHSINTQAAHAVRYRRHLIPQVLHEVLARMPGLTGHGFRFLSLASGPAWELEDVFRSREDLGRFQCALLDQDSYALGLARGTVARIEQALGGRIQLRCFEESVRTMLRTHDMGAKFGQYHFIYSMGLFDYLTPPVARAVLQKTYELLLPGGTIIIGNYHDRNPSRVYMEYWGDWPLYHRSEQTLLDLASGLEGERALTSDPTGCQMFLRLDKPA
jgi:extracellular factor (EF) 3-hydroxypalmitic acid methyl ester biosynthesis protein